MTTPHTARALAVVAVLCIGAGACGGSKSNSSSAAPGTTTAAGGTKAAGAAPTTPPVAAASGGGGNFCKLEGDSMKKAESGAATSAGTSPAALRKQYQTLRQTEAPAIASAPGELKGDLNLLLDASVKYGQELAKVDYDITRVNASVAAAFSTPPVQAASTHVLTYLKDTCGIDLGAGGATAPTSAP